MSVITELAPAAHATAGDDRVAPDTLVPAPTPDPGTSPLSPLAEHCLSVGMTPCWVRPRWPEMADVMAAIEALEAPQVGLPSLRQSM